MNSSNLYHRHMKDLHLHMETGHSLLPCYFCRKLGQEFIAQSAAVAVLDNGIATVRAPICSAHAKWPAVRLWEVLTTIREEGCDRQFLFST